MSRFALIGLTLIVLVLVGCSGQDTKKRTNHGPTYSQNSPFETGQDPFAVD